MDNENQQKHIDADVLQCKADLLRAKHAGLIKESPTIQEPAVSETKQPLTDDKPDTVSSSKPLPPALRPLSEHKITRTSLEDSAPDQTSCPPALRPLSQVRVNLTSPDKASSPPQEKEQAKPIPQALRPVRETMMLNEKRYDLQQEELMDISDDAALEMDLEDEQEYVTDEHVDIPEISPDKPLPEFNLAEQILAEQRRLTSLRRQKNHQSLKIPYFAETDNKGIKQVVKSITHPKDVSSADTSQETELLRFPIRELSSDTLNHTQEQLLVQIVSGDIKTLFN